MSPRDPDRDNGYGHGHGYDGNPTTGAATSAEEVAAANTRFYDAVESGDLDTVSGLWLAEDDGGETISCVHAGWPVLRGRPEVLRSYALIMANTEYIQYFLTDVEVAVHGEVAVVTCTENILSSGEREEAEEGPGPLVGGLVVATNVFRRTGEQWRLWTHHGSPVLLSDDEEESDSDAEE